MLHSKVRVSSLFVGVVVIGSTLPDLDHILPPFTRSWGHDFRLPLIILAVLVVAYMGRFIRVRVLRNRL